MKNLKFISFYEWMFAMRVYDRIRFIVARILPFPDPDFFMNRSLSILQHRFPPLIVANH